MRVRSINLFNKMMYVNLRIVVVVVVVVYVFTRLSEEFVKTFMTIWFIILFLERSFIQLFKTKCTHKMFRMEFSEHCCYASAGDWF